MIDPQTPETEMMERIQQLEREASSEADALLQYLYVAHLDPMRMMMLVCHLTASYFAVFRDSNNQEVLPYGLDKIQHLYGHYKERHAETQRKALQ